MNIKIAGLEDISTLREIANFAWVETYKNILSPEQYEYMLDMMYSDEALKSQMENGHHFLLIQQSSGENLGFVSYELNYKDSIKTKIHKLYVLPNQHGKGLGRQLINKVETLAIANDNDAVTLNMNRYNVALDFYKKVGFNIIGEEDIDVGRGYLMEDYIFEKKLK